VDEAVPIPQKEAVEKTGRVAQLFVFPRPVPELWVPLDKNEGSVKA
jgi:hypothetical protein